MDISEIFILLSIIFFIISSSWKDFTFDWNETGNVILFKKYMIYFLFY